MLVICFSIWSDAGIASAICPPPPPVPVPTPAYQERADRPHTPTRAETLNVMEGFAAAKARDIEGDWAGLCRFRVANHLLRAAGRPVRVVFMGDSITDGWGQAHPSLFSGNFVNRGIGGQTTQQMLLRFRQDVIDLHPAAVHILAGTNDILTLGGPVTPPEIAGDVESMVELADVHGISVVLGTVPPLSLPWGTPPRRAAVQAFNAWLRAYAHEKHVALADYYTVLVDRSGGLAPALAVDAVHPNRDGYARMESLMGIAVGQADR